MLTLELDAPAVPAGGEMTGTLTFTADKAVTPEHVRLELSWETRGRGDRAEGTVAAAEREVGPVAAGETVTVPFAARLPGDAPRSFAGELIELRWRVRGRVDVAWATNEMAEAVVRVVAPGAGPG